MKVFAMKYELENTFNKFTEKDFEDAMLQINTL